jgi:sirohydrochlorin ferrochelatase
LTGLDHCGVLLAAHGERGGGADNAGVERLAAALSRRNVAAEVGFGFIKGTPTISQAVRAFTAPRLIVYPMFFSDGYFTGVRLPQLLMDAGRASLTISMLPPLGLDPGLAALVAAKVAQATRAQGLTDSQAAVVLLAHGATGNAASRRATERLADRLRARTQFSAVACAFLQEAPMLDAVIERLPDRAVVVGLFAGEGLHGAEDVRRLIAGLGRPDVAFAGNVGTWQETADLVAAAISGADRASTRNACHPRIRTRAPCSALKAQTAS